MKLSQLLLSLDITKTINFEGGDAVIDYLSCDSRDVRPNTLLFCFAGGRADGHDFAADTSAAAFICEKPLNTTRPQIIVPSAREAMGIVAGAFYSHPIKNMKLVCITGTNGKTTTSYILRSIFSEWGVKTGLIGTTAYYIGDQKIPSKLTTPDPFMLHRLFYDMYRAGCKVVIMELSAHAIAHKKLSGVLSDITILTNITQDHLDFFDTFEQYKKSKQSFFCEEHTRLAVVNADDKAGEEIILSARIPTVSYGADRPSDVFGIDLSSTTGGIKYILNLFDDLREIEFALTGKFNMYNTMAAATAARFLGVPIETIAEGIKKLRRIEGRLDSLRLASGATAIIDYAHTPDGVECVLKALNEVKTGKLITVFGCGGDRDKQKRPHMGSMAARLSDIVVVTSDNPRSEEPEKIIDDIISGFNADISYMREADRKKAILLAINMAQSGDIVAVLGKGAETTQETSGGIIPFSDYNVILEAGR